jgi:hypothetical protein
MGARLPALRWLASIRLHDSHPLFITLFVMITQ